MTTGLATDDAKEKDRPTPTAPLPKPEGPQLPRPKDPYRDPGRPTVVERDKHWPVANLTSPYQDPGAVSE